MDWQQAVSLVIVAGAGAALAVGQFYPRKFKIGRSGHCGCVAASAPVADQGASPQSSIIFHARKGQRPEVRLRMR